MYNRYIPTEDTHKPGQEACQEPAPESCREEAPSPPPHCTSSASDGLTGLLRHFLDQFHLHQVDSGDLLLLALLFFMFREHADEELLVALGLLLIL